MKTTGNGSEESQRLKTARSHYCPWTGAQRVMVLSEVWGQDHLAGLFCGQQEEAQRRGKCSYTPEVTWAEREGVIQSGFFFLPILQLVPPTV